MEIKQKNNKIKKYFTIIMDKELYDKMKEAAKQDERTINSYVRRAVKKQLNK